MPQIAPMNWMMIFMYFIYLILYMKKSNLYEKSYYSIKIKFYKLFYVK